MRIIKDLDFNTHAYEKLDKACLKKKGVSLNEYLDNNPKVKTLAAIKTAISGNGNTVKKVVKKTTKKVVKKKTATKKK